MLDSLNIFYKKKILIYGLGKSGLSVLKFLKKNNKITTHDDKIKVNNKKITKIKFDYIIISPGIDINKCKLSKFLKNNSKKIYTDLDIFYNHHKKNNKITITGTNGKSTTAKINFKFSLFPSVLKYWLFIFFKKILSMFFLIFIILGK